MSTFPAELDQVFKPLLGRAEVLAACLVGSYARESSSPDASSDVDVLAVLRDDASEDTGRALLDATPRLSGGRPIELRTISVSDLQRLAEDRTVYGAHLAADAKVMFDHDGSFAVFRAAFPLGAPILERANALRTRFSVYESLEWLNGRYLLCLADLFAIGRSTAMLGLAQIGTLEFDRRRVFGRFAQAHPEASHAISVIRQLEPFYLFVHREAGQLDELPFSPSDCHAAAAVARDACSTLLASVR